jgi:hypothetical protein
MSKATYDEAAAVAHNRHQNAVAAAVATLTNAPDRHALSRAVAEADSALHAEIAQLGAQHGVSTR